MKITSNLRLYPSSFICNMKYFVCMLLLLSSHGFFKQSRFCICTAAPRASAIYKSRTNNVRRILIFIFTILSLFFAPSSPFSFLSRDSIKLLFSRFFVSVAVFAPFISNRSNAYSPPYIVSSPYVMLCDAQEIPAMGGGHSRTPTRNDTHHLESQNIDERKRKEEEEESADLFELFYDFPLIYDDLTNDSSSLSSLFSSDAIFGDTKSQGYYYFINEPEGPPSELSSFSQEKREEQQTLTSRDLQFTRLFLENNSSLQKEFCDLDNPHLIFSLTISEATRSEILYAYYSLLVRSDYVPEISSQAIACAELGARLLMRRLLEKSITEVMRAARSDDGKDNNSGGNYGRKDVKLENRNLSYLMKEYPEVLPMHVRYGGSDILLPDIFDEATVKVLLLIGWEEAEYHNYDEEFTKPIWFEWVEIIREDMENTVRKIDEEILISRRNISMASGGPITTDRLDCSSSTENTDNFSSSCSSDSSRNISFKRLLNHRDEVLSALFSWTDRWHDLKNERWENFRRGWTDWLTRSRKDLTFMATKILSSTLNDEIDDYFGYDDVELEEEEEERFDDNRSTDGYYIHSHSDLLMMMRHQSASALHYGKPSPVFYEAEGLRLSYPFDNPVLYDLIGARQGKVTKKMRDFLVIY